MSLLILPSKWTSTKPPLGSQIDFSHPLSRGLVGCWLMNEGGGAILKNLATNFSGSNNAKYQANSYFYNGSSDFSDLGSAFNPGSNPFTVITSVKSSHINSFSLSTSSAAGQQGYEFLIGSGGVAGVWAFRITGNLSASGFSTKTGLNDGKFHILAGCYFNSVGTWWVDGIKISNNATNPGTVNNSQNLYIARRGTTYFNGNVAFVYYYSRILSPQEIQQLYQEPYCFIQPVRRKIYFVPTGEIPTTTGLTLGWMSCNTKFWGN